MSDGTRSFFRRPGRVIASIAVVIIFLAGVVVLMSSLAGREWDPGTVPSASPTSTVSPASGEESVCGLDSVAASDTLTAAPDNEWELVGTVAAPVDPQSAGPGVVEENGFRYCYAHTPEGALFMAANFAAMGTDALIRQDLPRSVAPGEGRDALLNTGSNSSSSTFRAQVAGFQIGGYTNRSATVDLAVRYATGDLVSLPLKLLWIEGDWKVQTTDTGELPLAPSPLDNLGGYVPWSGA